MTCSTRRAPRRSARSPSTASRQAAQIVRSWRPCPGSGRRRCSFDASPCTTSSWACRSRTMSIPADPRSNPAPSIAPLAERGLHPPPREASYPLNAWPRLTARSRPDEPLASCQSSSGRDPAIAGTIGQLAPAGYVWPARPVQVRSRGERPRRSKMIQSVAGIARDSCPLCGEPTGVPTVRLVPQLRRGRFPVFGCKGQISVRLEHPGAALLGGLLGIGVAIWVFFQFSALSSIERDRILIRPGMGRPRSGPPGAGIRRLLELRDPCGRWTLKLEPAFGLNSRDPRRREPR